LQLRVAISKTCFKYRLAQIKSNLFYEVKLIR
jgi:hypothetical protein